MYICDCCNFKTTRLFNYQRHLSRATHERQVFLTLENNYSFSPGSIEPPSDFVSTAFSGSEEDIFIQENHETLDENENRLSETDQSDNDFQENHQTADENENCNTNSNSETGPSDKAPTWYPFSSKAEMLLYIFMNSTTHPVVSLSFYDFI